MRFSKQIALANSLKFWQIKTNKYVKGHRNVFIDLGWFRRKSFCLTLGNSSLAVVIYDRDRLVHYFVVQKVPNPNRYFHVYLRVAQTIDYASLIPDK